jgi:hypothetical protein
MTGPGETEQWSIYSAQYARRLAGESRPLPCTVPYTTAMLKYNIIQNLGGLDSDTSFLPLIPFLPS